ncbi:MAG TPA: alpha/beta fold hydrolase [Myxococcales bacterium]|nr:alpha/beta fold hydrolase [Myxococcales bacterium]
MQGFSLGSGPDACLLLHGLTGSPAEVRPVGEALAQAGFRVLAPVLPGHGTRPEDMYGVTRAELLGAARGALLSLAGAQRVFLCGLSAGALLALQLAARSWGRKGLPADFSALALLAPAVDFVGPSWIFTHVLGRLPKVRFMVGKGGRDLSVPEEAPSAYVGLPLEWGGELFALSRESLAMAKRVRAPVLILHGARDRTVSPSGARRLARLLASPRVEVRILPESGHVLPLDVESAEVCRSVVSFFQGVSNGQVRPRD